MFGEVGDALQDVFEEAAFLAGADHADGQFIENVRVDRHRLGEAGAVGDLGADVADGGLEGRFGAHSFEDVEAAKERDAGAKQVGQLRVEGGFVAAADAGKSEAAQTARACNGLMRTGYRPRASSSDIASRSLLAVNVP